MRLLLSILLILLSVPAFAENVIQNSGFEVGTAYWGNAERNRIYRPLQMDKIVTNQAHSGLYSMRIRPGQHDGGARSTIPYKLKRDTTYHLSYWLKSDYSGQLHYEVRNTRSQTYGGTNALVASNSIAVSDGWKRFPITFTTSDSSNTTYCFYFHNVLTDDGSDSLSIWMDDILLEEGETLNDWQPSSQVEVGIQFPDTRGANAFWFDEEVDIPIWTVNHSASAVAVNTPWFVQNQKFETLTNAVAFNSISANSRATNTVRVTRATNVFGTYRTYAYASNYDNTIVESSFSVIPHRLELPYPATNSHFGAMLTAVPYWATNSANLGLRWQKTLGLGRTNSSSAGQWFRWSLVRSGPTNFNTNHHAFMGNMTNWGFNIIGYIDYLRDGGSVKLTDWARVVNVDLSPASQAASLQHYTNTFFLSNEQRYIYPAMLANAYKGYVKYWVLGSEFDTEGNIHSVNGGTNASIAASLIVSNSWTAIKSNDPTAILIPINIFTPQYFHNMSNYLGANFFTDGILSSDIYGTGEHGAERLYTNVSVIYNQRHHWNTESGTSSKPNRQTYLFEDFYNGTSGGAGTEGDGASDQVTRAGEYIKNYVQFAKWPGNDLHIWHVIDEKNVITDPGSHTPFDYDGALQVKGATMAAMTQIFEGTYGRSNLVSNAFPEKVVAGGNAVLGGKFARGTTNCPIVVFMATNDMQMFRAHIRLATNEFNTYDMWGNIQRSETNVNFSHLPVIVEGRAGVNSNYFWTNILINSTYTDVTPPNVIFTHFPTGTNGINPFFRWAARDNQTPQFPQGSSPWSGKTNRIQYRWKMVGVDSDFNAWQVDPHSSVVANQYEQKSFKTWYTNLAQGNYTFLVHARDAQSNIGSNEWAFRVAGGTSEPEPPEEGARALSPGIRGIRLR